jgi:uncharacterized membrane protein
MTSAAAKRFSVKAMVWTLVAAGLALVLLANAHLVYMAVTSQPDCIDHVRPGSTSATPGKFSAASSSCTPRP